MYSISFLENCFNNENPMLFCKEKSVINLVWLPFKICTSLFMPNPNSRLSTHKTNRDYILLLAQIRMAANQFHISTKLVINEKVNITNKFGIHIIRR